MHETPVLDVDSLPDIEEGIAHRYIDLQDESGPDGDRFSNNSLTIGERESYFTKCEYVRDKQKLWLKFEVSAEDLKKITRVTGGLISADVSEGEYCFDIESNPNGSEDIYYSSEYVGQFVDGQPRVYKRFFIYATIQIMIRQNILLEYEPSQYTVHPDFLSGLDQLTQEALNSVFKKNGKLVFNNAKITESVRKKTKEGANNV